jgi:hypothetical protein
MEAWASAVIVFLRDRVAIVCTAREQRSCLAAMSGGEGAYNQSLNDQC